MNTLNNISLFIQKRHYQDFSPEVIDAVKRAFIDIMGVSLAGSQEEIGKMVTKFIKINR